MKTILILSLSLISAAALAKNCEPHIRYTYEQKGDRVIRVTLEEQDQQTSTYHVRGNFHSGDYLEEVIANAKTCSIISTRTIWAE